MPIVRSFGCPECNHCWEVTLTADQWDSAAPSCPECDARETGQIFTPLRINGSPNARANRIAEDIIREDYNVSDIHRDHRAGAIPKTSYNDDMMGVPKRGGRTWGQGPPSTWGANAAALEQAAASGRAIRQQFGSGLDVLQGALKSGAQPDLLEASKRKSRQNIVW